MATTQSIESVRSLFRLLNLPPPSADRLNRLANELEQPGGRTLGQMRDDLITWMANSQGISRDQVLTNIIRATFRRHGVAIATRNETEGQRLHRLREELKSGKLTLHQLDRNVAAFAPQQQTGGGGSGGGSGGGQPPPEEPEPVADEPPEKETVNYLEQVRTLYPWLPRELVKVFADAWTDTGDRDLAYATMQQSDAYEKYFPGNRRADGSVRMDEQTYFSTIDAYNRLLSDFGLNPKVFKGKFVNWIEGDVSPSEVAERLGSAYEQIVTNIPQVREFYASTYGIQMSDQAIFASFLDPDIGDAILNRRISVAQIGGEGLARGFDTDLVPFAERLADAGLSQQEARGFFAQAERQLPLLERLAERHADPDDTFDLGEFADAAIFGDSEQARRIRRLLDAEASLFSEQLGTFGVDESMRLTGLRRL